MLALSRVITALTVLVLAVTLGTPASAAPTGGADGADTPTTAQLQKDLAEAITAFNDAQGRLNVSTTKQADLNTRIAAAKAKLDDLTARVGDIAAAAYRGSRVTMAEAVLGADSPDDMMQGVLTVRYLVDQQNSMLRAYNATQRDLATEQAALADEIKNEQAQLAIIDQKKKAAQTALTKAGGGQTTPGVPAGKTGTATAVPRNPDGSLPGEGCSVKDPTGTGGCITPRMLNAYNTARANGFTHYTKCWRQQSTGEHPKGRACDFSANASTFVDARATGDDKAYGDRLAAFFIANSSRLGVLYVIWYKQIWQPSGGWKSYGGDGTPAGDHYNHVHLSVQ
jgi:hypothetical protein